MEAYAKSLHRFDMNEETPTVESLIEALEQELEKLKLQLQQAFFQIEELHSRLQESQYVQVS